MAAAELLFPKLVVCGASGPSGLQVVQQAFEKGHFVTAIVRSPEKFELKYVCDTPTLRSVKSNSSRDPLPTRVQSVEFKEFPSTVPHYFGSLHVQMHCARLVRASQSAKFP